MLKTPTDGTPEDQLSRTKNLRRKIKKKKKKMNKKY